MTDAATIAHRYIALWNETNPQRRLTLMAELWTETGTYADPLMRGEGHDEIDALIAGVQGQFPGFRFAVVGQPDGHGGYSTASPGNSAPRAVTAPSRAPTSPPWKVDA